VSILQLFSADECYDKRTPRPFEVGQFCWIPVPTWTLSQESSQLREIPPPNTKPSSFTSETQTRVMISFHPKGSFPQVSEALIQRRNACPTGQEASGNNPLDRYGYVPDIARILRQTGKRHLQEDSHFVVPCYSVQDGEYGSGFPAAMLPVFSASMYRQFFYLPPGRGIKEGIARFDRIQVVIGDDLAAITPMEIGLSTKMFDLFHGDVLVLHFRSRRRGTNGFTGYPAGSVSF